MTHIPACYFCLSATAQPVVTYVRWKSHPCPTCDARGSYAFLCAEHRSGQVDRIAEEHPIEYGVQRIDALSC